MESGEILADQKLANINPVYQKGMRKDTDNCRSVNFITRENLPGSYWILLKGI